MDTYKIINSDEETSEAEENIQTTKVNPATAEKPVPNPVEQTKNTSTSKKETLPQDTVSPPKAMLPNNPPPVLGDAIGPLVCILIFFSIACVVFGVAKAHQEQEVEIPKVEIPSTSIWSSDWSSERIRMKKEKVRTVPNMMIGLIWVGAGISQLLLALLLVVWKASKSFKEK